MQRVLRMLRVLLLGWLCRAPLCPQCCISMPPPQRLSALPWKHTQGAWASGAGPAGPTTWCTCSLQGSGRNTWLSRAVAAATVLAPVLAEAISMITQPHQSGTRCDHQCPEPLTFMGHHPRQ